MGKHMTPKEQDRVKRIAHKTRKEVAVSKALKALNAFLKVSARFSEGFGDVSWGLLATQRTPRHRQSPQLMGLVGGRAESRPGPENVNFLKEITHFSNDQYNDI